MKLAWPMNREVQSGNAFGYTSASVNLAAALEAEGVEIVEKDAPIAVHFCHPANFEPLGNGTRNVLFTMYELSPPPPDFGRGFQKADAGIVPTRSCYDLLMPDARRLPLAVVPLGFDPDVFPYVERSAWDNRPEEPFRFLYLGAQNDRKGFRWLLRVWHEFARIQENLRSSFHLTIKTTPLDHESDREPRHFEHQTVEVDERLMSRPDLAALYARSDAFVFPSLGEGFGLPPLEALGTGLPVVCSACRGPRDFLGDDKHGVVFVPTEPHSLEINATGLRRWGDRPQFHALGKAMLDVATNHRAYLARARRGSRRAREQLTWRHAARQLIAQVERFESRGWKQ